MTILAAWVCIISPFAGVAVTPALGRVHAKARDLSAVLCAFVAAVAALSLLPQLLHPDTLPVESGLEWLEVPIRIGFGVLVDPLSIVLANVVAVISFLIMVYCLGYMKDDPARTPVLDVDERVHRQHAAARPLEQPAVSLRWLETRWGL